MPYPRSGRVNPDDLAKRVARHLADTEPGRVSSSLRDSVLLARLASGVIALVATSLLALGVFGGVNWLQGRPAPDTADGVAFDQASFFGAGSTTTTGMVADEVVAAVELTYTTAAVLLVSSVPANPGLLAVLPSPTTTSPVSTTVPVTTSSPTATTSTPPGSTSSSSTPTSTSSSTTTPTTSTMPTTTTTAPTTTSSSSTTSTSSTTTTTSSTTTSTTGPPGPPCPPVCD